MGKVKAAAAVETPASRREVSAADRSSSPGASGTLSPRRPNAQVGSSDELHLACLEFIFRPRADGSTALWLMPCVRASGTGVIGTRVLRSRLMWPNVLSEK